MNSAALSSQSSRVALAAKRTSLVVLNTPRARARDITLTDRLQSSVLLRQTEIDYRRVETPDINGQKSHRQAVR